MSTITTGTRSQWPLQGALPITPKPRFLRITRKHRLYLRMVSCLLRRTTQGFTRNSLVVTSHSYGKPPATGACYSLPTLTSLQNPTRILVPSESTRRYYLLRYSAGDYSIPWQTEGSYPTYRIMTCLRAQTSLVIPLQRGMTFFTGKKVVFPSLATFCTRFERHGRCMCR